MTKRLLFLILHGWIVLAVPLLADVYRWDTGEVIPGTEGIAPGPRVPLDRRQLEYANLAALDLTGAVFESSNLTNATFHYYLDPHGSDLTQANLLGANLSGADLSATKLTDANLTNAIVTSASFYSTTSRGFVAQQLYSTQSYQEKHLRGIDLRATDLSGWDLAGQDLTDAFLDNTRLTNTILVGATVAGARLGGRGLTMEQLRSTRSYHDKNLERIGLHGAKLTGWNLAGQNMKGSSFKTANLVDADLSGANLTGANLTSSTLTNINLSGANLANAKLTEAELSGANLTDAIVHGVSFRHRSSNRTRELNKEQLYSTRSYREKYLRGLDLSYHDLTGWNFAQQDLVGTDFHFSTLTGANLTEANLSNVNLAAATLTGANLSGANLKNSWFDWSPGVTSVTFSQETVYNQWSRLPFDPVTMGLTFKLSPTGDLDGDDLVGVSDVDLLSRRIRITDNFMTWLSGMFNLNGDATIDERDLDVWVIDVRRTWFGDANLDGEFDSGDLVGVLAAGEYEDVFRGDSGWATGDWNADGEFTSHDLLLAFQDGG